MSNKIILVLGGSRSGKSEFAEKLVHHCHGKRKGYIATSRVLDEEMEYRVILHQKRRPSDWSTFEIFHEAAPSMEKILSQSDTILFDCITMYVNNILMEHMSHTENQTLGVDDLTALQSFLEKDLDFMFDSISKTDNKELIFVSDELGMGIVPASAMSRIYRDLVGLANQYVAKKSEQVYLSVAGITIELKSRGVEL